MQTRRSDMGSLTGVIIVVIGLLAAGLFLVLRSRSQKSPEKQAPKKDSKLRSRIRAHLVEIGKLKLWALYEFIEKLPPEDREREAAVVRAICMRQKKGRRVVVAEIRALTKILREDLKLSSYSVFLPRKKKK